MSEQSLPVPKKPIQGVNDLVTVRPDVAKLWHPTKNEFGSHEIMAGARRDCFWLGECGHEWEAAPRVMTRIRNGKTAGCPVCNGRQVIPGINDLESQKPEVAKEWHPTKNESLTAEQVTPSSAKRVWWLGECGHEWQDQVAERTRERNKKGCRVCSGAEILIGFNDLATTHPEIVKYWHPTKNQLTPQEITAGIRMQKFWWLGKCGHEWDAKPVDMTSKGKTGTGCPYCCGKKALIGFNDLSSQYPLIANEWNPTKNSFSSDSVVSKSAKVVWWKCRSGHEWETSIITRTRTNQPCPECLKLLKSEKIPKVKKANQRSMPKKKSFSTVNLEKYHKDHQFITDIILLKEWHPTKNYISQPTERVAYNKTFWWLCEYGHEWKARVNYRLKGGRDGKLLRCVVCAGRRFLRGFNDLATTHPEMAQEWHPTKNFPLLSSDIQKGSNKRFWWQCSLGHDWQTSPNSRTKIHSGRKTGDYSCCPTCSGRKTLAGFNDLATTRPELAVEWHPTLNGSLLPTDFTQWNNTKVWWQCKEKSHHEWEAAIYSRSDGRQCPHCNVYKSKIELELYEEILKIFSDAQSGTRLPVKWGKSGCSQVDIYLPSNRTVIEYDGSYWHENTQEADTLKTQALIEAGYHVVRIRHFPLAHLEFKNSNLIQIEHYKEQPSEMVDIVLSMIKQKGK